MKLICIITLILLSLTAQSQDFGWRTIYSAGGNVIQYRVVVHHVKYLGDAGNGWATKIFCRSTFNEAVEYSLIADVTYPNNASFHGKTENKQLLGWGVLYDKNNRQNEDVGDWVSWTNTRFEKLIIGRQRLIKDGIQVGSYNPNSTQSGGNQLSNNGQGSNTTDNSQQQLVLERQRLQEEQRKIQENQQQEAQEQQRQQEQEQRKAQESQQREIQERQTQQEYQQQEQQRIEIQNKQDEEARVKAKIDAANRQYHTQSAAIDATAQALGSLMSMDKEELATADDFVVITGGIHNLLSPFLTSNRTTDLAKNPLKYYGSIHFLNRGIFSVNATISGVNLKNESFKFFSYNSAGGESEFFGVLEAKAIAYQLSIGKDFVTKDGRFHFYLAPMLTYWSSLEHKFTYNGGQIYSQDDIKKSQLLYGIDAQVYWLFDEMIGINAGIKYNIFSDKPVGDVKYKPTDYTNWNVGISLRIF